MQPIPGYRLENDIDMVQMLKAIWPSLARLPNNLPASANITTSGIMCYFLYWLIQVPFISPSPIHPLTHPRM